MTEATEEQKVMSKEDKIDILKKFVKDHKRKFGEEKVVMGFGNEIDLNYDFIEAPIPSLSSLLAKPGEATGGIPRGMYTIIGGPERSGKSTFCWQLIANDQLKDPTSIWAIAAPEPLDEDYMKLLGVDMERVFVIKDGLMEDVMQRIIELSKTNTIKGFVVDSIGALTPKAEVYDSKGKEHELEHTGMLDLQRKLGQFFRMSNVWVSRSKAACILITHVYQDPNGNGRYVLKGGNALKHFSYVRLKLSRSIDTSTDTDITMPDGNVVKIPTGHDVTFTLDKSKQNANENKSVVVPYRYGIGLDIHESNINMGINLGVIVRSGAWYSYTDSKGKEYKAQGRESISKIFKESTGLSEELIKAVQIRLKAPDKFKAPAPNLDIV